MLRIFADLGVRYMTLSHFYNDEWADSSTDKPAHNGLTEFGKDIVREMNRQGMMVDISHVSDKTFYDALAVSKAPLIASHSSCRALCNHARNMTDDMIKALAAKGGVIQINYEKSFIDQAYKNAYDKETGGVKAHIDELTKNCHNDEACISREMAKVQQKLTAEGNYRMSVGKESLTTSITPRNWWGRIMSAWARFRRRRYAGRDGRLLQIA